MTAAFDATGATQTSGSDQRFSDALSGADGTGDPSVLMPVLDVYPDALSAPMPVDVVPVLRPTLDAAGATAGVRAMPVAGPAARTAARPAQGSRPAGGRPAQGQPARNQPARNQPARNQSARNQPSRSQLVPQRPMPGRAAPANPARSTQSRPANPPAPQGRPMTAADVSAMFRNLRSGQSEQVDRLSYQATHPQSIGSGAPSAVAPAAPMASQYSARGQVRNTARDQAQERRRTSSGAPRRQSSVWAVLVFFVVIVFASGLGQKAIDLFNELFNR